jgi:hypothetical protein
MTTTWIVITHFFRRKFQCVHRGAHSVPERMPDLWAGTSAWLQDVGRDRPRNSPTLAIQNHQGPAVEFASLDVLHPEGHIWGQVFPSKFLYLAIRVA